MDARARTSSRGDSAASRNLRALVADVSDAEGGRRGSGLGGVLNRLVGLGPRTSSGTPGGGGGGGRPRSGSNAAGDANVSPGGHEYRMGRDAADGGDWNQALVHYRSALALQQEQQHYHQRRLNRRGSNASVASRRGSGGSVASRRGSNGSVASRRGSNGSIAGRRGSIGSAASDDHQTAVAAQAEIATTLYATAVALKELDEPYAAMTSFEECLAMRQSIFGPGHEDVAETVSQITGLLDVIRRDSGLEGRRLIRGAHTSSGMALNTLFGVDDGHDGEGDASRPLGDAELDRAFEEAQNLLERAQYKEAEMMLRRCLDEGGVDCEEDGKAWGHSSFPRAQDINMQDANNAAKAPRRASHCDRTLTAMAQLERAQGRYTDAQKLSYRALSVARDDAAAADHSDETANLRLAECICSYAEALRKGETNLQKAHDLHCEALRIRKAVARAAVERSKKRRGSSGSLTTNNELGDANDAVVDNIDDVQLDLASSFTQYGATLSALGRYEEAYARHRDALAIRFDMLDFVDALVAECLNYMAESLVKMGRPGEAICPALHAVEIRKLEMGTRHPAFAHALATLASAYHAAGRSIDALPIWEKCLNICADAFGPKHANFIPNLVGYGGTLAALGDRKRAIEAYQRALDINKESFSGGGARCGTTRMHGLVEKIKQLKQDQKSALWHPLASTRSLSCAPSRSGARIPEISDVDECGDPIIIITDVGRDIDDELALCLLAPLREKRRLQPLAVITTLSPQADRARVARGTLDSLGLHDVPVGVGSAGGAAEGMGLDCYAGTFRAPRPAAPVDENGAGGIAVDGLRLMREVLDAVPDKSLRILCIASLTDLAQLIQENHESFLRKVREVVVMGGVQAQPLETADLLEPDSAYNNNCDMDAAQFVYRHCQLMGVPTVTLTRHAAYGCTFSTGLLDELRSTEHLVAANIRNTNLRSINKLWAKVNLPKGDAKRERLPDRCDRRWFCDRFLDNPDSEIDGGASIWSEDLKFYMYDPLALLCCVPLLREKHFKCKYKTVFDTVHAVVGISEIDNGVANEEDLFLELSSLLFSAFEDAMQCLPVKNVAASSLGHISHVPVKF